MKIQFDQKGTWAALRAAEAWCKENGISVGQASASSPTGLLFGNWEWIAKWRNLTVAERAALHGTMEGDRREGPVVVSLKDQAVREHRPQLFLQVMPDAEGNSGRPQVFE